MDLPDPLFRRLKMHAAECGVSLSEIILAAIHNELKRATEASPACRRKFPLLASKHPGSLRLTNVEIDRFLA